MLGGEIMGIHRMVSMIGALMKSQQERVIALRRVVEIVAPVMTSLPLEIENLMYSILWG